MKPWIAACVAVLIPTASKKIAKVQVVIVPGAGDTDTLKPETVPLVHMTEVSLNPNGKAPSVTV